MNRQFAVLGGVDDSNPVPDQPGNLNLFALSSFDDLTELIGTNQSPTGIEPVGLTNFNGQGFLFDGTNASGNFGLWFTNPLAGTTSELPVSGADSLGVFASPHFPGETYDPDITVMNGFADGVTNGKYVFAGTDAAGDIGLFVSANGTPQEVTGIANAFASGLLSNADNGVSPDFTVVYPTSGNPFYVFDGQDSAGRQQLWVTTGSTSASGTTLLTPSGANPAGLQPTGFFNFNGTALFQGIDTAGKEGLWVTNGTSTGTTEIPVSGANAGGIFNGIGGNFIGDDGPDFTPLNGVLLFRGTDAAGNVGGIWQTTGPTTNGIQTSVSGATEVFAGPPGGLLASDLTFYNGKVLFAGADAAGDYGLWVTDGTAAGTQELVGIPNEGSGGFFNDGGVRINPNFTVLGGLVYFAGFDGGNDLGLWVTDGTVAGTEQIANDLFDLSKASPGVPYPNMASGYYPPSSDFVGNGVSDILLQNGGSVVSWMMANGNYMGGATLTTGAGGFTAVGTGDFTGSGTSDVLLQNGGTVVDWIMSRGQYVTGNVITTGAAGWLVVGTGDVFGVGTSGVVLQNGGTVVDWAMKNGAYAGGNVLSTGAAGWSVVGTGDFNADGTTDLLLQNGGTVVDWILKNGQYQTGNVITTGATGWTVVGTGDFTGNGTTDVLLQNGGTVVAWIMQNGQYQSGNVLTTAATGWQVVGTGDYTGDGISDVLLQNGGTVVDWIMRNGQVQSGNVVTNGAPGWHIAPGGGP